MINIILMICFFIIQMWYFAATIVLYVIYAVFSQDRHDSTDVTYIVECAASYLSLRQLVIIIDQFFTDIILIWLVVTLE